MQESFTLALIAFGVICLVLAVLAIKMPKDKGVKKSGKGGGSAAFWGDSSSGNDSGGGGDAG